jgi:hypothetical protein
MPTPQLLLTVGELARRLGEPLHRIEYVINSRNIEPVGWPGNARVFREADLDWIAAEFRRMAAPHRVHPEA